MTRVEIDDRLYVLAQSVLDRYEGKGLRIGGGEAIFAFWVQASPQPRT